LLFSFFDLPYYVQFKNIAYGSWGWTAETIISTGFVRLNTRYRKKLQIRRKKGTRPPSAIGFLYNTPEWFNISIYRAMLPIRRIFFLCVLVVAWPGVLPASAWEYHLGLDMGGRLTWYENYLDRGSLELTDQFHFSQDRSYQLLWAAPYLSFTPRKGVTGYLQGEISWDNSDVDVFEEGFDAKLIHAYLSLSKGGVGADLGQQTVIFGNGLIMADEVPAAVLNLNQGKGYLQLTLAQALDSCPMAAATLGYRPGYFENMALFGIWFQDQDDAFAKAIPYIYQLLFDPQSEGDLYWAGVSAELLLGKVLFTAVGAYQWGDFRLYTETDSARYDVSAYLADLCLEGNLTSWCSLEAFVFATGGDDPPIHRELNTFVAIMPYNPRAAIFFDPEFMGRDADDERLTFNGGFFGGVIAPGLALHLESEAGLSAEAAVASFYAPEDLDDGSRWYGWEVDLTLGYTLFQDCTLYLEAAQFQHGDYYESLLNEEVDPATRLSVGFRYQFAR
jgi:hypothetical protein